MIMNKLQLQVKSLTVNKNGVSENHCDLRKIAVAQCERALTCENIPVKFKFLLFLLKITSGSP